MAFTLTKEHPAHFEAQGSGGSFKIAKNGLSKARLEKYQALCRGGTVQAKAEGGEVEKPKEEHAKGWGIADKISAALPTWLSARPAIEQHNERLAAADAAARDEDPPRKLAKGGEVKGRGLDLSKHKLVEETGDHWHIQGPGGSFKVAKKGLGKGLADKIAQHFADGGEVDPTGDTGLDLSVAPETVTPEAVASLPPPTAAEPMEGGAPGLALESPSASAIPSDESMLAAEQGTEAPTPVQPASVAGAVPSTVPVVQTAAPRDAAIDAAVSSAANALGGRPTEGTSGGPNIQGEIGKAYKNAEAAAQAQADVAKREAADQLLSQQKNEENRQALTTQWTQTWQTWQKRGDELRQSILSDKVDPNHYWESKSTGGKVTAAIGLILGGIGSGLTHQPNAALTVIQNAIDRDIDAQKANLGKKATLLGFHMQEGHALQASYQLARADMLDAAAAKIQMTATKFAGDKAQATAQGAIAGLQREAAMTRQQVAATGLQMQLQGMQFEQAKLGLAMSRAQMGALSALTSPGAQPGTGQGMGTRIDPRVITFLSEPLQKKLVTLPDGTYAVARDEKAAGDVSKSLEGAQILRDKMARYGAILAKHPHGVSSMVSPQDYDTAQALRESILTDINGLSGLNRFTETEAKVYGGRVPDITSKQARSTGHQAKLAELGREIDDKIWATNKQYLNLPPAGRIR